MATTLAQKGKSVVLSLYNNDGCYRNTVAAEAVNAARLHGSCQILVMNEVVSFDEEDMRADVKKFKRAVGLLEMPDERLSVIGEPSGQFFRLDVLLG